MQGFDSKTFIEKARAAGVPDSETFNFMNTKGLIPKGSVVQSAPVQDTPKSSGVLFPSSPTDTGLVAGAKSLGNLPGSLYNTGKSLVSAVAHPFDTAKGITDIALGGVQKLIPGQQSSEGSFDAVVNSFKDRYGSLESAQKTATEDPFGFGSDVVALFSGVGGLAKTAGLKLPGVAEGLAAGKAYSNISKVGGVVEAQKAFSFPQWFGDAFQKSSLNLSTAQKANLSNKLGDVATFLNKNKAIGTPEMKFKAMEKLTETKFEPQIQKTLNANKNLIADKNAVQDSIRSLKQDFFDDADFNAISNRVDNFAQSLDRYEKGIPVDSLNKLKRSAFKDAFTKTGDKVSDVVEFAIADKLYESLSSTLEKAGVKFNGVDLNTFNKSYKTAIEAKKVLNIARKRPLAGFISRATGAALGAYFGNSLGGIPGAAIGTAAGQAGANLIGGATNFAKGAIGKAATVAGKANVSIPAVVGAGAISGGNVEGDYLNQLGY